MAPRDGQRQAVYRWENCLGGSSSDLMTQDECRALVQSVWYKYERWGAPHVYFAGRGASGSRSRIRLGKGSRNPYTVLHETAHALEDVWDWEEHHAWHGKVFATLLLELLRRWTTVDTVMLRRMGMDQRPRRVHFAQRVAIPQPRKQYRVTRPYDVPRMMVEQEKVKPW